MTFAKRPDLKLRRLLRLLLGIATAVTAIVAGSQELRAETSSSAAPSRPRCLTLDVYIRGDSESCLEAVKYVNAFAERRGGICVRVHDVHENKRQLADYWQLMRKYGVEAPVVPAFLACSQLKLGFQDETKSGAEIERLFSIHAYIRPTCQHCRAARKFLAGLNQRWPAIRIVIHDVDRESGAMQSMTELARSHGVGAPSMPTISICGRVISGYQTDATTGRRIEQLLLDASIETPRPGPTKAPADDHVPQGAAVWPRSVRERMLILALIFGTNPVPLVGLELPPPQAEGLPPTSDGLPPADSDLGLPASDAPQDGAERVYAPPQEAPEGIEVPWVGYIRLSDWGLPAFTLLIGLIDGFNPCAMWVLVFLLSVLVNIKDRKKIAAIALTFVIVSGLAYYAFMAAWLNLFMLVGIARPIQIALALLAVVIGAVNVKDFFAFKQGVTLSIPESVKPGIYARVRQIVTTQYLSVAIGFSVILAVLINVVELLCTAGLPAVYTQILSMQGLPAWQNYAYLALYIVAYMLDDGLMVTAFLVTLSHRKMRETEGRWLKLVSGVVVLGLGAALLFRPDWLQW